MELFYERNFYGVLGLLIAACIAMYRFFTKTQAQQLENTNLKLEINFNKKILESEKRLTEIIKKELKEAKEDFKKDKDHMLKNVKYTNDLMVESLKREHDNIVETGNKILNNIKKAND